VVNRQRCEGGGACAEVCPNGVFELAHAPNDDSREAFFQAKLERHERDRRQAYAVRADQCQMCGLCVKVCPSAAIQLVRVTREWGRPLY